MTPTTDPQNPTLLDAIEKGQISLDDALTHYRPPTGGERAQTFGAILGRAARDAYLSGTSAELRLAERGLRMLGADDAADWTRGFADYVAPGGGFSDDVGEATGTSLDVPDAAQNEQSAVARAFTQLLPEGLGSSIGMIALPGPKGLGGVATRGALVGAGQQFVEAKANGADDATAWTAFVGGSLLGATEAGLPVKIPGIGDLVTPLGRMFARADAASGGKLKDILWEGVVKGGAKEFTQEYAQTIGENLLALGLYDEDRKVLENALDSGVAGALTGFLFGALHGGSGGRATQKPGEVEQGDVAEESGEQILEPDEHTATMAKDMGAEELYEAPKEIKEYVEKRGGRVAVGRGKGGARLKRPASYLKGSILLDSQDVRNSFLDHEVGHLAFEQDPEGSALAREAIEKLAPGLHEAAQEDYIEDVLADRRRTEGRDLTPEEEAEVRSTTPPDEAFARINEDFSGIVRLLRRNPEAFSKLDNPSTLRKIFRAVVDLGRKLTGKPIPDREALALADTYAKIRGPQTVAPEVGVEVAKVLRTYLDGLVPKTSPASARATAEATPSPSAESVQESAPETAPETSQPETSVPEETVSYRLSDRSPDTYVGRRLLSFSGAELDTRIADRLVREDAALREQFPDRGEAWYQRAADLRRQARDPKNVEGDRAALQLKRAGIQPLPEDAGGYSTEAYMDARAQQRTGKPDASKVGQGPKYATRRRNPQENTLEFKAFFRKSAVVDDAGKPLVVYRGDTNHFTVFDRKNASPDSDFGKGFYFSNSKKDVESNYAGEGPDLTVRIQTLAERIADETDRSYDDPAVVQEARDKLKTHGGATTPAYLSIQRPFVLGGGNETTFSYKFDEGTGEESGSLVKFINALKRETNRYELGSANSAIDEMLESGDGISASSVYDILKNDQDFGSIMDENGDFVAAEVFRAAIERAGYDGIIDSTVDSKFGSKRRVGKQMENVDEDTVHYVVFDSSQIKSAIGNNGTFDPKNPDIRYAQERRHEIFSQLKGEERAKFIRSEVNELLRGNTSPIKEVSGWVYDQLQRTSGITQQEYALAILNELRRRSGQEAVKFRKTDTIEFKRWFKNSKGVDENGKPRIYYHGTKAATKFNTFRTGSGVRGAFFTPDPKFADVFAGNNYPGGEGVVYPVFLKFEDPFDIRDPQHVERLRQYIKSGEPISDQRFYLNALDLGVDRLAQDDVRPWSSVEELSHVIERAGFDSYYVDENVYEADASLGASVSVMSNNVVVFEPTQIKSAIGNNGNFDPGDPDIRHAVWRRALPTSGTLSMPWDVRDNLLRYAQDSWRGPGRWRDALATAGKVTESNDIALQETLRRSGTLKVVQDESSNYVAPLREAIARGSVTVDEAGRYLLARAAPDRNKLILARGGPADGSGMSDADAAKIVAAAQNGPHAAKYAEIAGLFDKLTQRKIDLMEQYGLLTPEAAQQYRTQEPFYAPMKSDPVEEVLYGEQGRGTKSGIGRTRRKEFRAAAGRSSEADNPLIHATMDLMAAIERGMWNATTGRATLEMAREFSDPKVAVVDVPATQQTVVNGQVRTVPAMERDNEVVVKENGVPRVIRFGKGWEPVAEAIKGADRGQADVLLASLRTATRVVAGLSTRWNPAFQPVNFVRDALTAHLNASADLGPAAASAMVNPKTLIWAAKEMKKNGPWAERFRNAGGPVAFLDLARTFEEESKRTIKEIRRLQSPNSPWEMPRRQVANLMKLLEAMGNISENASRLAAFKYAVEELGASDARAAQYAKELTTNFERRGTNAFMSSLYAFSNASVQGTTRVGQALRTPWGQRAAASLLVGGFLLSYMNRITGGDDDDGVPRWDKIPDWQRRSNAIFLVGDEKLMIPMPFVWNIFSALGTEIERGAFGRQTPLDSVKAVGGALANSLNPLGGEADLVDTITPTLADPLVQIARNQDYAGRAIFPPWVKGPDSGKAWDTTSPTAVKLAEGLNELSGGDAGTPGLVDVSPATLEFIVKQYLGGVGGEGSRVLRLAEKFLSGEDVEAQDWPVVRRFYGSLGLQEQRGYYRDRRALIETQVMREKAGDAYDKDLWRLRKRASRWDERISELEKKARSTSGPERDRIRSELRKVFLEATSEIEEAMK